MLGILENTTVKFSPKFEQKKIRHNFLSERGLDTPSYTPGFVGDFVHYTPYKGFRSHGLDERQLIEIRVN